MKTILSRTFLFTALASTMLLAACNKKKDTIAKVHVFDKITLEPVAACTVTLEGISTLGRQQDVNVKVTAETNASGEAIFNFNDIYKKGQAGVAVLDIDVKKDGRSAEGIIKVEEETTSEETVYL